MNPARGGLSTGLVIVTSILWVGEWLGGFIPEAAVRGGFIAARLSRDIPVDGFFVPAALTPLTATLVHADIFHLGFNMLMLAFCGRFVETVTGTWRFALLYVAGAFAAAAGQFATDPLSLEPMIGASGAISAVIGAYALYFSRNKPRRLGPIPPMAVQAAWLAAAWIGIQWLFGIAMGGAGFNIAIAAHIGGFIAGLVLAYPLLASRYRKA